MNQTSGFWGSQGRVGRITSGELSGRSIFMYPDTLPGWWTMVIEPSPYPDRSGEDYTWGADQVDALIDPLGVEWMALDDGEREIERRVFGRRPLVGMRAPEWLPAEGRP